MASNVNKLSHWEENMSENGEQWMRHSESQIDVNKEDPSITF